MPRSGLAIVDAISKLIQNWCEEIDLQELLVKLQHILMLARKDEQQMEEMRQKNIQLESENDDLIRSIEKLTACVDDESDEYEKAYNSSNYSGSSGSNSNNNNNKYHNTYRSSNNSSNSNDDNTTTDVIATNTNNNNTTTSSTGNNGHSNKSNTNNFCNMHHSRIMRKSLLLDKHFHADPKNKYLSLQELRQHADFGENIHDEDYKARRRRKVKTEIWDTPEYTGMGTPMGRGHRGRSPRRSLTKIDFTSSIEIIKEEMKKEKARRRVIVDDSVNAIEKIKAKLELERMKNRRIIERKIKRISELERKVDQYVNEARDLRNENKDTSQNLCECQEELSKMKLQQDFNKEDLTKYKNFFMDRFVLYNFISKDLNSLESCLPSQRLCFPRYKRERTIIGRIKKLLGDGMSVNYTVRPTVTRDITE